MCVCVWRSLYRWISAKGSATNTTNDGLTNSGCKVFFTSFSLLLCSMIYNRIIQQKCSSSIYGFAFPYGFSRRGSALSFSQIEEVLCTRFVVEKRPLWARLLSSDKSHCIVVQVHRRINPQRVYTTLSHL